MKAKAEAKTSAGGRPKPEQARAHSARSAALAIRSAPAVILLEPQLGENIGFAARAMANFGLYELRLVAPRDGWPNEKAVAAAAGADAIVKQAELYPRLEEAIGDLTFLLATTARPRDMVKPVLSPKSAAAELVHRGKSGERTALLFGPERSGLDNDAISLADAIVTAPVNPSFASLSLPQAVLLVAYEWYQAEAPDLALGRATRHDGPASEGLSLAGRRPASRAALLHLFRHLEAELDRAGFLHPPEKRPGMVRAIRNMFHRMGATEQDVRTWRGIVAALGGKAKRRPRDES